GALLKALEKLNPFIAEDASRQWARGILFRGSSAFATNNVTLVEYWLGYNFPVEVNIPKPAVQELLRIGEEPTKVQVCENSITFHYASGRWLRTQTYSTQWPDVAKILDRDSTQRPFPEGFFEALADLLPFADNLERVYFLSTRMATTPVEGLGASVDLVGLPEQGIYNIRQLQLLEAVAETIDLSQYPAPCLFYGDRVRGATVGMRGCGLMPSVCSGRMSRSSQAGGRLSALCRQSRIQAGAHRPTCQTSPGQPVSRSTANPTTRSS